MVAAETVGVEDPANTWRMAALAAADTLAADGGG